MTATFSPDEAARLAAIDAAPDAPESWAATVERMARAMWGAVESVEPTPWEAGTAKMQAGYRRLAEAALRVVTEPADPTCVDVFLRGEHVATLPVTPGEVSR